ncbi:MAG: AmmeMemoRadiSam system radical SAM enzyme, partial [Sphingobacteriales bacterium]|nr:AmmeMemoRadiSam system radical SAM enzyme [Sphingobacteriales bacterium]
MQYAHSKDATHIICDLCKHHCVLKEDGHGICGINYNINGELVNKTYNHPSAIHLDPIEKKPLYHFLPASKSLSIGTVGCNFRCPFCQNYTISQTTIVDESVVYTPQKIVELALAHGAQSISYTYNEPTIWYPYARDIGLLAKEHGLKNVFVSSGYESEEVLSDMPGWVDAANIDLKSFDANYYKHVLKTELAGVLATLRTLAKSSVWLEVTTLLIPDVNDSHAEIEQMAQFMACEVGTEVPWHFSAFHPDYKMLDTPNTSPQKLLEAKEIAQKAGMKYVYLGNIAAHNDTYCPKCNA